MTAGERTEERALRYLEHNGLELIVRNWRCRLGELDLVMRDGDTVVVAEVRGRSRPEFGTAAESVDARKQLKIQRATQQLLAANRALSEMPLRFDIVAVNGDDGIEWIKAAFEGQE